MKPHHPDPSPAPAAATTDRFPARELLIVLIDLAGYTRACSGMPDPAVAAFLDDYYTAVVNGLQSAGGRVVKFIGDAVLAVFEPAHAAAAVNAVVGLNQPIEQLARRHGVTVLPGANLHIATVSEGELGPEGFRRYDIIGMGVNQTFLMGGGAGIRISETVYQALPADQRTAWDARKPTIVYHHTS